MIESFLANAPGPVLILVDDNLDSDRKGIPTPPLFPSPVDGAVVRLSQVGDELRGWKSVLLVTEDRASLRRVAACLPRLGFCRTVGVWLYAAAAPLIFTPRPEWPLMSALNTRPLDAGYLCVARFEGGVAAHQALVQAARCAAPDADGLHHGLVLAYADMPPVAGLDVRAAIAPTVAEVTDAALPVPPDIVIASGSAADAEADVHPVTERAAAVVTHRGPGPVDEAVFNPMGFLKDADQPVVDVPARVTEETIVRLRPHLGARAMPDTTAESVLRLSMAGVPVTGVDRLLIERFGPRLGQALSRPVDLFDALAREQHSLRVRRAAFDHHSVQAWRVGRAHHGQVRRNPLPEVSVVLATRRPDMLGFALRQLAAQQAVDLEVVVAAHGFTPREDLLRQALRGRPGRLVTLPESTFFGDVLQAGVEAASASVLLKVDDDDWYSPYAVHDLLMARRYSGADVVGMPSEFVYLAELDLTVRRNHPSEVHNRFVAGGTLMFGREVLDGLGGFRRVRRYVDAQFLSGVEAAGGRIYRTHGLGYVLRRNSAGHTWEMSAEQFRREAIVAEEREGFDPPPEFDVPPQDRPAPPPRATLDDAELDG